MNIIDWLLWQLYRLWHKVAHRKNRTPSHGVPYCYNVEVGRVPNSSRRANCAICRHRHEPYVARGTM